MGIEQDKCQAFPNKNYESGHENRLGMAMQIPVSFILSSIQFIFSTGRGRKVHFGYIQVSQNGL